MLRSDTISAIATGLTDSGIGIIRISGENAALIGNRMLRSASGKELLSLEKSHVLYHGYVADIFSRDKESYDWKKYIVDEVMAVLMKAPRSFTGEDTVEIQCHGGVFVMQKILELSLKCGARLAEPGEFTKRAFLNGRMDLSRAEAVMDLIHSKNEYALSSSINHLKGILSHEIQRLRKEIIYEIAFIESALDDPEHVSLEGYPQRLLSRLESLASDIEKLISTSDNGRIMKEGVRTVILGKPNVGKSSLLNCLLGEDRAIVTEIAGTTRDVLEETVRLGEISLNVMDTAGIHHTEDTVEKIGVEKAKKYAEGADLIVYVVDVSLDLEESDREIISSIQDKKVIVLLNKSDLPGVVTREKVESVFREFLPDQPVPVMLEVSAKNGIGMDEFEKIVKGMFFSGQLKSSGEIVITNLRHKEALQDAFNSLNLVRRSIEEEMPEDFYSIDLMNAYSSLGRIIGEEVDDDLVEEIFSKFCMGK